MDYSLKEAAALLDIAPSTLHKWNTQFAALLSDLALQARTVHGGAVQRHYTEADIAVLLRAKTLLRSGYTYDQACHELSGDRSSGRVDLSAPGHALPMPEEGLHAHAALQTADEQAIAEQDQGRAAPARTMHVQYSEIDQLHEHLSRLQLGDQELHAQEHPWEENYTWRLSYRAKLIFMICGLGILLGMLAGIGIVLLIEPHAFDNVRRAFVTPIASPVPTQAQSARLSGQQTAPALLPPVPAATAPTASPPLATSAPQPVAEDTVAASAEPALPSPPPPTLTAPKPALAATEPLPTIGPASAEVILLQVAEAEAALRMGQIEATITYGSGQHSSAQVRFDLGDEQRVPRFQITTTYTGTDGAQTTERITIGDQVWQRQQEGQWTATPARESALKQLQVFLPRTDSISDPKRVIVEGTYVLRWYDAARDADVTLILDAAGIPRQLRRLSRVNGLDLTVTYSGWNKVVDITRPD
jgi:DNA-binding transcriptional MerR regulator